MTSVQPWSIAGVHCLNQGSYVRKTTNKKREFDMSLVDTIVTYDALDIKLLYVQADLREERGETITRQLEKSKSSVRDLHIYSSSAKQIIDFVYPKYFNELIETTKPNGFFSRSFNVRVSPEVFKQPAIQKMDYIQIVNGKIDNEDLSKLQATYIDLGVDVVSLEGINGFIKHLSQLEKDRKIYARIGLENSENSEQDIKIMMDNIQFPNSIEERQKQDKQWFDRNPTFTVSSVCGGTYVVEFTTDRLVLIHSLGFTFSETSTDVCN